MAYEDLIYERRGFTAWITLNRPKQLNALRENLVRELYSALEEAERSEDVRVVVLRGAGRAFSAGYDLVEEAKIATSQQWRNHLDLDIRTTMKVWDMPKPVIAAVHGYCLAGACELAMACDLTIAAEDAVLGEPEIRFGSGPVTLIMPWVLGLKKTRELLYTGDTLDAREAERLGMVNRVVPADKLEEEVQKVADKIAKVPPEVMKLTKIPLNRCYEMTGLKEAIAYNLEASSLLNSVQVEEQVEFNSIVRERGLKAALEWRDNRYQEKVARMNAKRG
ncbi:MAG: enoyl-CoA hydratase/isomerase family protein [Acidobacteriota bacterium]